MLVGEAPPTSIIVKEDLMVTKVAPKQLSWEGLDFDVLRLGRVQRTMNTEIPVTPALKQLNAKPKAYVRFGGDTSLFERFLLRKGSDRAATFEVVRISRAILTEHAPSCDLTADSLGVWLPHTRGFMLKDVEGSWDLYIDVEVSKGGRL